MKDFFRFFRSLCTQFAALEVEYRVLERSRLHHALDSWLSDAVEETEVVGPDNPGEDLLVLVRISGCFLSGGNGFGGLHLQSRFRTDQFNAGLRW
jgi:hypothetical protein